VTNWDETIKTEEAETYVISSLDREGHTSYQPENNQKAIQTIKEECSNIRLLVDNP
jgi:VCBS repeat-containing protein